MTYLLVQGYKTSAEDVYTCFTAALE